MRPDFKTVSRIIARARTDLNWPLIRKGAIYSFVMFAVLAVIGTATLAAVSLWIWPQLPSLEALTDYRPRVPLRVYTADGYLIQEIGEERRAVVKIENVPANLKNALVAAEDEHFYTHMGFDPTGIARAALSNLLGRPKQGASTITQQVAKTFFLKPDRSFKRKLYELLLALKIERNLSKDQILQLYINQIYLGHRAYGFEVAAQTYFGKPLADVTLAEAGILASLPKAPSKINPIDNPSRAKLRQLYVLRRMREINFIDDAQYQQAKDEPVSTARGSAALDPSVRRPVHAEYIAEMARQIAIAQVGETATQYGVKVYTTITRAEQEAAYESLRQGVMDYDRRHGYRGPEKYISLPEGEVNTDVVDEEIAGDRKDDDSPHADYGDLLRAVVLDVSAKEVTVYRNGQTIQIKSDGLKFPGLAAMLSANAPQTRRVRRGALVRIRNTGDKGWELTQVPEVEAALIAIDSRTGAVRALVGGFDFYRNQFNNVTMARRQPGSSFKPFIYSAAIDKGYAPGTLIDDAPLDYEAGVTGRAEWSPHNYDNKFEGPMLLRDALVKSKNIPAIRVLEAITPDYARQFITNFGFDAASHPPYLTMALGAGAASPWEMATGYAVFANGGYLVKPHVVTEIRDVNDETIAKFNSPVAGENAPRVIDARNAWVMDSMLHDVVSRGTGARARVLNRRDLAGKTGTTNDYVDAWFCGYSGYDPDGKQQIVAVTWMGFPTPKNMGKGETGGIAALPLWINYMRHALKGVPDDTRLPRPEGILSAPVGDGSKDDFYLAGMPPPEIRMPDLPMHGDDLFGDLQGPPSDVRSYIPPAPVPRDVQEERQLPSLPMPDPGSMPAVPDDLGGY